MQPGDQMQQESSMEERPIDEQGEGEINEVVSADFEGGDAPMDEDSDGEEAGQEGAQQEDGEFQDTSIAAFYEHRNSIFTLQLHPRYPAIPIAFSGGADDKGRLWDTRTGESLAELDGHQDSVVAGGFSVSGEFVATGGLDGRIRIWRIHLANTAEEGRFAPVEASVDANGQALPSHSGPSNRWGRCEFVLELDGPDEVIWLNWHPKGNVLAAGASDATVWMWNVPAGNVMHVFSGHTSSVTCGQFTPDGRRLVTTSEDGSLIVWDPRDATALSKLQRSDARFNFANGITALTISHDGKVAIVGGATGTLRVINLSNIDEGGAALVVSALVGHDEGESVESVQFIDLLGSTGTSRVASSNNVVSIATDGKAIVWDVSTAKVRCEAHLGEPMTDLVVHGAGPLFSTSSADGKVITWDARTANHVAVHAGFTDAVLNLVVGPDDGFTQGTETGGIGAFANPNEGKGWKLIAAGDEGVALVFRV